MMLEFSTLYRRKAKKEHICSICSKVILPGEVYQCYSGKYDGFFFYDKYCTDCKTIIDAYVNISYECEYSEDDLEEWLQETYCYFCVHGCHADYCLDDCETSSFHCKVILQNLKERMEAANADS